MKTLRTKPMLWDIDAEIEKIEAKLKTSVPGTALTRCCMDVNLMKKEGLRPTADYMERGHGMVWSLAVGVMSLPKRFFYGHTIREVVRQARKAGAV